MPRAADTLAPPKVSFSNWILGGDLVTHARRRPAPNLPITPPTPATKDTKPKHRHSHHSTRRSRDQGTDTEKDAAKATQKKEWEIEVGQKAVPKDEVARKEDAQKNHVQSSSTGWTSEQDGKLMAMKKAGNSWKMIAHDLGASKKDVVNRFKELCDLADNHNGKGGDDDDVFGLGEMPGMFTEDDADATARPSSPTESRGGKKGKGKGARGNSQQGNNQSEEKTAEEAEGVRIDLSAVADDSAAGRKVLRPDGVWTMRDLEVLADVEQRYRELKWMYVQAGFYNLTGRMVGAEIVRAKFEEE